MKTRSKKSSRVFKRVMAFVMSLALAVSTFAVSPSADAASAKKPKLSVKKKTLYYNKAGKKKYTLKVKKNKVKKIKKTKWKTSKKSVVKLSKKKKKSVKLTAKKAGKATITAKVKYKAKGSKKVKTKKLKCKVTVKKWTKSTTTPTPIYVYVTGEPSATATPSTGTSSDATATATTEPTTEPTATPDETPVATKVEIEKPDSTTIGTLEGYNELTLTAKVYDQYDNEMTDQTISWKSDDETIATVEDGKVTGLKSGAALIYATVDDVESVASASIKLIVDGEAPVITKAEVTDYANITVSLSEAIVATDDAKIEVYKDGSKTAMSDVTATLSEDGTSLVLSKNSFAAGTYEIVLTGYEDAQGNAFEEDTNTVTTTKDASYISEFLVDESKTVPAFGSSRTTTIYYKVKDQYGEEVNFDTTGYTISVAATVKDTELILNGTTVTAPTEDSDGYVTLPANSALTAGETVSIVLTCTKDATGTETEGTVVAENTLEYVLADSSEYDTPVSFDAVIATAVDDADVASTSTDAAPVFNNSVIDNGFTISSTLFNSFGYNEATGKIKYVIDNTDVIAFGTSKTVTADNTAATKVTVKGAGTATITATLDSNADVEATLTVKILNPSLEAITVAELAEGINSEEQTAAVTLNPDGTTLTGADLTIITVSGADSVDTLTVSDDTKDGTTTVNVHAKAAANGKTNTIKYVITNGTADDITVDETLGTAVVKEASQKEGVVVSEVMTYTYKQSTVIKKLTFNELDEAEGRLTVNDTATATYTITNKYDEDITSLTDAANVSLTSSNTDAATVAAGSKVGEVTITGVKASASVTISATYKDNSGDYSGSISVKVDPEKYIKTITFGTADAAYISGDDPIYIEISAVSQYDDIAYTLTADDFTDNIAATNEGITIAYYAKDGDKYVEATGDAEVVAIGVIAAEDVTKDTDKEIKLEKAGTSDFTTVTKTVTVRPSRTSSVLTLSDEALTALADVTSSANLTVEDQYGDVYASATIASAVKVVKTDGSKEDSTAVTVTVGDYNSSNKVYPISVSASTAGTYEVTLYTDADASGSLSTSDPQTVLTFTVGAAADLVSSIEFTGYVGDKKLADVEYIKVGTTATDVTPKLQAKDADGNVVEGFDETDSDLIWYYTPSSTSDFTVSAEDQTVAANGSSKTGSVTVKVVYGAADAEISVPVSNAASVATEGTYQIYDVNETLESGASYTDIKDGNVSFQADGTATLKVIATDQYGDEYEVTDYYGIDTSDETFATVAQTAGTNEIIITRTDSTGKAGKAEIGIYITKTLKYTVTATAIDDYKITLTSDNCSGIKYGSDQGNVTVADGAATIALDDYNEALKIDFTLPDGSSLKDYSGISFTFTQITAPGSYDFVVQPYYNTMYVLTEKKGVGYFQTYVDSNACVLGSYTESSWTSLGGGSDKDLSIAFDWDDADPKAVTGSVSVAIELSGYSAGSYKISNVKLIG